jgi:hypothetical protein
MQGAGSGLEFLTPPTDGTLGQRTAVVQFRVPTGSLWPANSEAPVSDGRGFVFVSLLPMSLLCFDVFSKAEIETDEHQR